MGSNNKPRGEADLLTPSFFQNTYEWLERDLSSRSQSNTLCENCTEIGIDLAFSNESEISRPYGTLGQLATNGAKCPFCRLVWHLLRNGAGDHCCGDCRGHLDQSIIDGVNVSDDIANTQVRISVNPTLEGWTILWVTLATTPTQISSYFHINTNSLDNSQFVHPMQADYFRVSDWIHTCETEHESCNDQSGGGEPDALFGYSRFSLRVIDVELRRIVQCLRPIRYVTLSYVWGASANRKFKMVHDTEGKTLSFESGVRPLQKQPEHLITPARLPRTFEDLIVFTKRLRERYIWIDAMCIPQDEPDVLADQIAKMDQVYFHSAFTIVSLSSGVEHGLPGASTNSPRNTYQRFEELSISNGRRYCIATPLQALSRLIEYQTVWATRGWTLQEHFLSRRSIFMGDHQVYFVCKEMNARECWKHPLKTFHDDKDKWKGYYPVDNWRQSLRPLPSSKFCSTEGLREILEGIVHLFTMRNLTFANDRYRAFQGLEARLSTMYGIKFLHSLPLSDEIFPVLLLWGRMGSKTTSVPNMNDNLDDLTDLPSWTWLSLPGIPVTYQSWQLDSPSPEFPTDQNIKLGLPKPQIHFVRPGDPATLYNPSQYPLQSSPANKNATNPLIRIRALSLDIPLANYPPASRRLLANALFLWENKSHPTPRGDIIFNIGMVGDEDGQGQSSGFPRDTEMIRLLRVTGFEKDMLTMPMLLKRGEKDVRRIPPHANGVGETRYSAKLDWIEPDYSGKNNYLGLEPDVCLLVVEANSDENIPVRRLGVAYVRMMDFLIAGAEERVILLK